jgi:hypothetical protein
MNPHLEILVDNNIFILDVAVCDAKPIEVLNSVNDLGKHVSSLFLRQTLVFGLFDAFKEIMRRTTGGFRTCARRCY